MKIDRLFEITFLLLDKKSVTAQALADKFQVSVRTIYRDIDILSSCGIPIYTEQGRNGGIHMMEQYALNKTLLTDNEQSQIIMALQSMKATGQEEAEAALSKLRGIFQKNIDNWIEIDFSSWGNSEKDRERFAIIKKGILDSIALSFQYFSGKGEQSNRVVEPYKLFFKGQSWYLYAYCKEREDFRFFKLSRIENLNFVSDSFCKRQVPMSYDEYREEQCELTKLQLKIDNNMAFRIQDELRDCIVERHEDYCILEVPMKNKKEMLLYLLSFADAVEILAPKKIREEYIVLLHKIMNRYHL